MKAASFSINSERYCMFIYFAWGLICADGSSIDKNRCSPSWMWIEAVGLSKIAIKAKAKIANMTFLSKSESLDIFIFWALYPYLTVRGAYPYVLASSRFWHFSITKSQIYTPKIWQNESLQIFLFLELKNTLKET